MVAKKKNKCFFLAHPNSYYIFVYLTIHIYLTIHLCRNIEIIHTGNFIVQQASKLNYINSSYLGVRYNQQVMIPSNSKRLVFTFTSEQRKSLRKFIFKKNI